MRNYIVFVLLILLFTYCAFPGLGYNTSELDYSKDEYTGTEELESTISFIGWHMNAIVFRNLKKETVSVNRMIGKFTDYDWNFYDRVDMLIDDNYVRLEAVDNIRSVISGSSIEEIVYFDMDDELIRNLKTCKSLKMRFKGERGEYEIEFGENDLNIMKRWITKSN